MITVPSDGGNVLTKENLVRAMDLFTGISEITIAYEVRKQDTTPGTAVAQNFDDQNICRRVWNICCANQLKFFECFRFWNLRRKRAI